jgi:peptidoglycan-associated lipoprotein
MMNTRNVLRAGVAALGLMSLAACATKPKYEPALPPAPPVQTGPIPGSEQDFIVNVGDRAYFDFDQYSIRDDARPVLEAQAAWLARYPTVQVRIEGNCDERGTREYNFALGARRAEAVRSFLVAHGVPAGRITTISYGKERPLDLGHDESAWAKDRNAHTALTAGTR